MPKAELPLWQRLERALVKIAKGYGFRMNEDTKTGDKLCYVSVDDYSPATELDLTELAKDLEKELER